MEYGLLKGFEGAHTLTQSEGQIKINVFERISFIRVIHCIWIRVHS